MSEQPFHYPSPGQPIDELALAEIKSAILAKLRLAIGKDAGMATKHDWYKAAALALRDRIVHRWLTAEKQSYDAGSKRVYYLSLEFLIGRLFTDALNNMGLLYQGSGARSKAFPGSQRRLNPDDLDAHGNRRTKEAKARKGWSRDASTSWKHRTRNHRRFARERWRVQPMLRST